LTPESKELAKAMLNKNPDERISALDALKHPWFCNNGTNLKKLQINFTELDDVP
jgi:Mg2+/Co2+ transporter CorB